MDFHNLYTPLIAGNRNYTYIERGVHAALAPYVCCYWYFESIPEEYDNLIIPDTCVDIIFSVERGGSVTATFCGVNDKPSFYHDAAATIVKKHFAVRFYAWTFSLFSGDTLQNTRNVNLEADLFLNCYVNEIKKRIHIDSSFEDFIDLSNKLLIKQFKERFQNSNFMNALFYVFQSKGNIRIDTLADQCFIGKRQLERLFRERMDLSPKQFTNLIRYQNTWRGILLNQNVNELVYQLGYTDQSHLLREFKAYHGMAPNQAKIFVKGTGNVTSPIVYVPK